MFACQREKEIDRDGKRDRKTDCQRETETERDSEKNRMAEKKRDIDIGEKERETYFR